VSASERFGFAPTVGFDEGLRRTFEWYRSAAKRSLRT
jgi:nucleoside-diphosphate-sugar epimerase